MVSDHWSHNSTSGNREVAVIEFGSVSKAVQLPGIAALKKNNTPKSLLLI